MDNLKKKGYIYQKRFSYEIINNNRIVIYFQKDSNKNLNYGYPSQE